jgi:deoxyribonuclease-1
MRIRFVLTLPVLIFSFGASAQEPPSSFSKAKRLLADIHHEIGHLETLYCGCPYERTTASGGDVDRRACGLEARKNEARSDRIEWEHVVPASWMGSMRPCWQLKAQAYPACDGLSGRKCCERVSLEFRTAHNDLNNLFPSSGEVNGDRSNHPFGEVADEPRLYGSCDFEIHRVSGSKIAEPALGALRGVLARAMLYMAHTYGVDVKLDAETVWEWHENHPPAKWEIERAALIESETGQRNIFILDQD